MTTKLFDLSGKVILITGATGHLGQAMCEGLAESGASIAVCSTNLKNALKLAGALSEIGVPQNAVPLALVMFNVGVEIGQVAFVTVVAGLIALIRRFIMPSHEFSGKLVPYAIGAVAAYWTIERTFSFL